MCTDYILFHYYIRYLREICKVKESTIKHYTGALETISALLIKLRQIENSIYEIKDIDELGNVIQFLKATEEFIEQNERGHRMYSAALNNYFTFARGEGFLDIGNNAVLLDREIPLIKQETIHQKKWKRSTIIKNQVIEMAGFACEINKEHRTFIAANTKRFYMEGHHIIPMRAQNHFNNSLDVYANIICLCPNCHRFLHYGIQNEKEPLLADIYENRQFRLEKSGIFLNRDEFIQMAI